MYMRVLLILLAIVFYYDQWSMLYAQSQTDIELMARAARAESLDNNEAFQATLEAYKLELAGKYLFEEQSVTEMANDAFSKVTTTKYGGNKNLDNMGRKVIVETSKRGGESIESSSRRGLDNMSRKVIIETSKKGNESSLESVSRK